MLTNGKPSSYNEAIGSSQPHSSGNFQTVYSDTYTKQGYDQGQNLSTGYNQTVVVTQPKPVTGLVGVPPPDYIIPAILACVCFCPTGIFAIYHANKRTKNVAAGNMAEAYKSAERAKKLMIASFVCGLLWIIAVTITRTLKVYDVY